jgi:hypothetical protein
MVDLRQSFRRNADAVAVLITVTPLSATFGPSRWSWLGGPVSSLAIYALGHADDEQAEDRLPRTKRRRSYRENVSSAGSRCSVTRGPFGAARL